MKLGPFSFAIVAFAFVAGTVTVSAKEITSKVPELSGGCYQISTAEELYGFAEIVNGNDSTAANPSVCGKLTKDIVVNDSVLSKWAWPGSDGADYLAVWEPIKEFSGTFDGNGHVISGLYSETGSGLFKSFVSSSEHTVVVKDLGIIDSYFLTKSVAGVLVESVTGDGEAQITNFYSLSDLEAARSQPSRVPSVGGVVGYVGENTSLTLTNCYSAGELVDNKYEFYSQLIGYPYSLRESIKINNCYVLEKGSSDNGVLVDSAAFRDGAVAYLLRENSSGAIWGQDVGKDPYPNFSGKLNNSIAARYTVEFHTFDGDTAKYFDNYVAGLTTMLPKGTSKENLVFGGWYRNADFSGENDTAISNTTTGDLEYWARMYDRYKIIYHANGGVTESGSYMGCGNPTASYQDALILGNSEDCYLGSIGKKLLRHYTRDSSIFIGWYDNEELTGNPVDSITTSDKGDKDFYAKWYEYKRPAIDPADSCYMISDAEELYGFSALADGSFTTGKYNEDERLGYACGKLTKDIVVNENVLKRDGTLDSARMHEFLPWKTIAFYNGGIFDGQGHTVSGLYINGSEGMFYDASPKYYAKTITIRNLKVKDSFISSDYDAGGIICSYTNSTAIMEIENTHFDGAIYVRGGTAGGLVSEAHNLLIIRNSGHRGIIHATSTDVGGIIGHADEFTVLVQNYNEGSIVIERPPVEGFVAIGPAGGLVGEAAGNFFIANNYNVADIETKGRYGGLIGAYYVGDLGKCQYETCRPERSFVLNNYSKGRVIGDKPSKMYDSEVTFENNFYLDGTLPEDSIGTPVKAEAFEDSTVAKALQGYVLKDSTGAEVVGSVRGDNWIQGDEYPVFSVDKTQYLVLLYVARYVDLPTNVLFHTPGQVLPLPTPSRYGYSFAGWKWGNDIVTEIPATVSEDLSVSAQWKSIPSSSSVASSSSQVSSSSEESSSSEAASSSSGVNSSSSSAKPSSSSSAGAKSSSSIGKDALPVMGGLPQFALHAVGREIQVVNARVGAAYAVLDLQGRIVKQGQIESANFAVMVERAGNYLVRIGSNLQMVRLK